MGEVRRDVWVYAEGLAQVGTKEACLVAGWLASRTGGRVTAWVFGEEIAADDRPASEGGLFTGPAGLAAKVCVATDPSPAGFEPRVRALTMAAALGASTTPPGTPPVVPDSAAPLAVIFPASNRAAQVAAALAATLQTGLISHAAELRLEETLEVLVPAFGELAVITCHEARPILITLGAGVARRMGLTDPEPGAARCAPPGVIRVELPDEARAVAAGAPRLSRVIPAEPGPAGPGSLLAESRVVVAGGAGAAKPETWSLLEKLADLLGAAVGATRPAVDTGVAGEDQMIGQSGLRISPDLYLALGVSGDLQHTVGIEGARTVIAINRDPQAPIFTRADYGMAADVQELLPPLIAEIERARAEKVQPSSKADQI